MSGENMTPSVENNAKSTKRVGGVTGKGFMPRQSGNPGGRPKKRPITELYEKILSDPKVQQKLRIAVESMILGGRMAGQLQLKEMAERVEGKVTQPVEVNGELNLTLSERFVKAKELKEKARGGE